VGSPTDDRGFAIFGIVDRREHASGSKVLNALLTGILELK
jgi:hypothetical protein